MLRSARLLVPIALAGCAAAAMHGSIGSVTRWPYPGVTARSGYDLAPYRDRMFSGRVLEIDPTSRYAYTESGVDGGLAEVAIPETQVMRVLDFGPGVHIENMMFHPRDGDLLVIGSTFSPENLDHVDFARALLRVDTRAPRILVTIPLKSEGFCRGLAVHVHRSLLYALDAAGSDVSAGATLSKIDLLSDELVMRRSIGGIPPRVGRRGLVLDDRTNRLYTLLQEGGSRSDFEPVDRPPAEESAWLAVIDADSLAVEQRFPLPKGYDYVALAPAPRGLLVMGVDRRGSILIEYDTRFLKEGTILDLPEPVSDMVADDRSALLPGRRGIYVVDLELMTLDGLLPLPLYEPEEIAMAPNGMLSCVIIRDPEQPGGPALGVVNLDTGSLERMIQ